MLNKYGDFSESGDKFYINTPNIERNWYNFFFTDNYVTFTSQAGIGEGILQDRMGNRIMPVKGRGLYAVCDGEGWCLNGLPVYDDDKKYLCTHAPGYTVIELEKHGVRTEYGLFVPNEDSPTTGYEVAWVRVKNLTGEKKTVKMIAFCDNDFDGAYRYQGYNVFALHKTDDVNGLYYGVDSGDWNGGFMHFESFITCGQPLDGWDCARNAFIGPYGTIFDPRAIHEGGCKNSDCIAEKSAFAVQTALELEPSGEGFCSFIMGVTESVDRVNELTARFDCEEKVSAELDAVIEKYKRSASGLKISTPDKELDKLFNNWLPYQANLGSRWARVGHLGYRDMTGDTDALACVDPALAFERLKRAMTYQYSNGYAPRSIEDGAIRDNNFADNTVWLTFAGHSVVNELGDGAALLSEEVEYNDGTKGSVYEHLCRSVDWLYNFRGLHGLIKIWEGDWNDCITRAGREGKGVSVWLTMAWYRANSQLGELAEIMGDKERVALCRERAEEMKKIVDEFGRDEEGWYIYARNDADRRIGAHEEKEGRIHLASQVWAVISDIADKDKQIIAMDKAEELLSDDLGTAMVAPPYTYYDRGIGTIGIKHPGVHENGGVYLHAMVWKLAADALLGRAGRVDWDIRHILPFRNPVVDGRAEPYVMSNSYMEKETGYRYGTPGQSWRTASGQRFMKSMTNFVFGIKPTQEGLRIEPCLPTSWSRAEVTKIFRGAVYHIKYLRTGRSRVTFNGKPARKGLVPALDGEVEVLCEF
ncbi:MAG: hypothetical protein IJR90_08245 [Clostridia bacterium]|nr:hypothetical protein [Clostridia bacterium]